MVGRACEGMALMTVVITDDNVVSPYRELMAYECIYATEGTSRARVSRLISEGGGLPSRALRSMEGFVPDERTHREVDEYVGSRLGGFSILVEGTPQFPSGLRSQRDPLPVFYYRGDLTLLDSRCVSIVGTRRPSGRGVSAARRLAHALAARKITVVMGLAAGVDTEAARGALEAGGGVIGVIGTPIDRYYPRENRDLQDQVANRGLLISQVPIYHYDHQPFKTQRFYFPERNVTMAALSEATVIVEAGETSGTRTQARACLEQGRGLILLPQVVDGTSWGRGLLAKGAVEAMTVRDVLDEIGD